MISTYLLDYALKLNLPRDVNYIYHIVFIEI